MNRGQCRLMRCLSSLTLWTVIWLGSYVCRRLSPLHPHSRSHPPIKKVVRSVVHSEPYVVSEKDWSWDGEKIKPDLEQAVGLDTLFLCIMLPNKQLMSPCHRWVAFNWKREWLLVKEVRDTFWKGKWTKPNTWVKYISLGNKPGHVGGYEYEETNQCNLQGAEDGGVRYLQKKMSKVSLKH